MKCKICQLDIKKCFKAKIINKYDIEYFHCLNCDFIQTEDPYWLEEVYEKPINLSDTGYMTRNLYYSKRLTILLPLLFGFKGRYLDYAGGYGVFVRIMRDIGFDFNWDDKYTQNLFSNGFEWNQKDKFHAVTLFEVFEHFVDPIKEIKNLLDISDTIIFSTDIHPNPIPEPDKWWYYGLDHGQHIALYSKQTFLFVANKFNLNYYNIGNLHILTKLSISKWKIYILILSKFGFHKLFEFVLKSKTWEDYFLMKNV
jgi:hypothetical protein